MELIAIGTVESPLTDRASAPKQGAEGEAKARRKRPRKRRKAATSASANGEVDLAGANGDTSAGGGDDQQESPVVDTVGDA